MRYLLDTNICIHAMKHNRQVLQRMRDAGRDALCISAVVVGELAFGVARSAEAHRQGNEDRLRQFLRAMEVLRWSEDAAWIFGNHRQRLMAAGTPIGDLDLMIGAHALADGLIVVTNNTREFERIEGLRIEDWTTA